MNDKPMSTRSSKGRVLIEDMDGIAISRTTVTRWPSKRVSAADQEQTEISRANYASDTKRAKVTLPKVTIQRNK